MGVPAADHSCGEWQYTHPESAVAIYRPRSNRCGVRSNVRLVSGRALGPINGRQPMVKLMPITSNANSAINPISKPFPSRVIVLLRSGLHWAQGSPRVGRHQVWRKTYRSYISALWRNNIHRREDAA